VHVPASADLVARLDRVRPKCGAKYPGHLDLRYGRASANRDRLLQGRRKSPTCVLLRLLADAGKETFALFAAGPMAHGINVALTGYTLARMQPGRYRRRNPRRDRFLAERLPDLGGDGRRSLVSAGPPAGT